MSNLGSALVAARRFEEAVEVLTESVATARRIGRPRAESASLGPPAHALRGAGRYDEVLTVHRQDIAAAEEAAPTGPSTRDETAR
ncbi:hypothetical protein AMK15_24755 [Streptomyces sp. MJM1172]|nr:hypothetical protein AMK15_24755 [Streptomyces sp. MJM1172]